MFILTDEPIIICSKCNISKSCADFYKFEMIPTNISCRSIKEWKKYSAYSLKELLEI